MILKLLKYLTIISISLILILILTNIFVIIKTKNNIISLEDAKRLENVDCILTLGAGIRNNKPSPMLEDRLKTTINLYQNNISQKILVSGEGTKKQYDEVTVMKNYLIEAGIPLQDIVVDNAGISTYDSIYRAKNIFQADTIIIVTQEYHLYRALYIAQQLNIEAYGIPAEKIQYSHQSIREIREILARTKDFFKSMLQMKSKHSGKIISLKDNKNNTNNWFFSKHKV